MTDDGVRRARPLFVVFGASGDLVRRKLLPALFWMDGAPAGSPPGLFVLGTSRHALGDEGFRELGSKALAASDLPLPRNGRAGWCRSALYHQALGRGTPRDYARLATRIQAIEQEHGLPGNRVLYLALPAPAMPAVIRRIGAAGLANSPGWTRIVVEKPFGVDLRSARRLNAELHRYFREKAIFRIDHYLGKETVQNLLVFRFANAIFEAIWNRARIDHVEITVAESLGVEDRAAYYEKEGALRDMVQSHLTQLLALAAMEVPSSLDPEFIRNEKVKLLRAISVPKDSDVVRGQYTAGRIGPARVVGYRSEKGVRRASRTETFVALRLEVHNFRWEGVRFFLRTGKRLPTKCSEIVIVFRPPPVWFFSGGRTAENTVNRLTITLQPNEGIELAIEIKRPGRAIRVDSERLHFRYAEAFGPLEDAYPTLLLDLLRGDQTLFVRSDESEESWRLYDALLRHPPPLHRYRAGTWGPAAAAGLADAAGHVWSRK
jgi:glucose-6-phosphate 1-dehydrogenase